MESATISREVIMAHSAYARAAGLQSEVNKITVTRVAGNEVEYKRQMNLYKKDMMIKLSNIRREEKLLKKSMIRYHKKKRQNHLARRQRAREEEERDKKAMENATNVLEIHSTSSTSHSETKHNGSPDSGIGDELVPESNTEDGNQDSELSSESDESSKSDADRHFVKGTGSTSTALPVIQEDFEEQEMTEVGEKDSSDDNESSSVSSNSLKTKSTKEGDSGRDDESQTIYSPLLNLPSRPLKPKKQVVSFADLIKLQHSTSTKKLFNLVHLLADKHGVKEEEKKPQKENRNSVVLRGSTDEAISDSLMRAASVLYPMKFGYIGSTELPPIDNMAIPSPHRSSENSGRSSPDLRSNLSTKVLVSKSEPNSSRVRTYSRQTEPSNLPSLHASVPTSPKLQMKKRNNSMPVLVAEVGRIKKNSVDRITSEATKEKFASSKPPVPRFLKPLDKKLSTGDIYPQTSDRVSWTEAFGLLKVVHSLHDF